MLGAIAALQANVLKLERDAAGCRALIEGLMAKVDAGIAGEPATPPGEAAVPPSAPPRSIEPEIKAAAKERQREGGRKN